MRMPRRVGSIVPSSPQLADRMAREVREFLPEAGGRIIEIGAGTGAITRALAEVSPKHRMTAVEADRGCCVYLRRKFPRLHVIEGLVEEQLDALLTPDEPVAIVSSVPLFSLTKSQRASVLAAYETLVGAASRARVVQFTYVPWLPEPRARSLLRERVRAVWQNIPPAWVWSGTHAAA